MANPTMAVNGQTETCRPEKRWAKAAGLTTRGWKSDSSTKRFVKTTERDIFMNSESEPAKIPSPAGTVFCRGVRGAATVEENSRDAILLATRQLLALIVRRNGIHSADIASATFTVTKDLDAEFPAFAARQLGWLDVPLLCGYEVAVQGSLQKCIRVLIHWNTTKSQKDIHHVYIHDAVRLRPDLSELPPVDWEELEAWITDNLTT